MSATTADTTVDPRARARAGFGRRAAAFVIDSALVSAASLLLTKLLPDTAASLITLVFAAGYYIVLEGGRRGQTLGKRAMGVRVLDVGYRGAIGYDRAAARWLGHLLSAIVLLLGYVWMLWDPERQTWHDKLASSIVVPVREFPIH